MKNKVICALLALIMILSLLPMTAMAEDPTATVNFSNNIVSGFSLSVKPGEVAFVTTDDTAQFVKWEDDGEPTDKFIKFDYPADGSATLKVTFKNIEADVTSQAYHNYAIRFEPGEYAVALELIGTNKISHGSSACIKYYNAGGMTITGSGSLSLTNTGSVHGSIWADGGDLTIKDTALNIVVAQGNHSLHHAILATKGSVTLDGAKITATTDGGCLVFFGQPQKEGDKDGRYTLDPSTDRKLVIKNSDITFVCNQNKTAFKTTAPAVISNSTLKLTTKGSEGPLISPAPTFEGDYTAIAGLAKNAEKLDKLKEFNPKKLASYTYIYIVPGIQNLLPTEAPTTEATQPETTEPSEAPTTEATEPSIGGNNDATQPTTGDKNDATKPTTSDKTDDKTDKNDKNDKNDGAKDEEKSGSPLKIILIVLVVLVVVAGAAVGVILYLRNKNAAAEEGEEEEGEEEAEEEAEAETEAETEAEEE